MDKKLFFYEFKQIGKYPLFIAAAYVAVWLLCGEFSRFPYNSLDYADFFATALLYAAFFFPGGGAAWGTGPRVRGLPNGRRNDGSEAARSPSAMDARRDVGRHRLLAGWISSVRPLFEPCGLLRPPPRRAR